MIKDEMNLALSVDTADIKTTIDASLLPDEDILPYTVGYIPWEMIQKSTLFAWKYGRIKYSYPDKEGGFYPVPNPFDDDSALVADRGIPFCYAVTNSTNIQLMAIQRSVSGDYSSCGSSYMQNNVYSSQKNLLTYANLSNIQPTQYVSDRHKLSFKISLAIINPNDPGTFLSDSSATGNGYGYVDDYNYITGEFTALNYTINIDNRYGGGSVLFNFTPEKFATIDESGKPYIEDIELVGYTLRVWVWCVGMEFYTRMGVYRCNGFTISPLLYRYTSAIGDMSINGKYLGMSTAPMASQYGTTHSITPTGFYRGYYNGTGTYYCYINTSNELIENEVTLNNNDQLVETQNGLRYKNALHYGIMFKSFNATDAKIMSLISTPIHIDADGDLWCPEFNDSYELTGNWIPYVDQTIDPDINEFDPADIPVPEPPTPQDDENTGSDITRPQTLGVGGTNGFITQYALNAAQVAEIGRLLWLSFVDPDYYKNFLFTLATTGTLNLSNLLDYFISLRVYPFPLINVPSHASAGTDMYIGAGIIPLAFSTTLHTINNYADYIDAGTCTVPRYYNDFRDYINTQVLLYLPYCGTVQLNAADVVGNTLHAQYAIDFGSGGVNAYVDVHTHDGRQYPIASLSGSIGADIPLTATNAAQIAARIAGDTLNFAGTVGDVVAGDFAAKGEAAIGAVTGNADAVEQGLTGVMSGASRVANVVNQGLQIMAGEGVKMPMLSGGRGFGSFGAPQTAYIQIRRGLYAEGQIPKHGFSAAHGEEYQQPVIVSSCSGFTTFTNVDTAGLSCSADERAAIQSLMQSGIFI